MTDAAPPPDDAPEDALTEMSDLARALPVYQQVMGLDREHAPAMVAAGLIRNAEGDAGAAEWLLRRSIKVAPTVIAWNNLGHILLGRRDWDGAINAYRASLEIDPTNTTTWPNLLFGLDLHPGAIVLPLYRRRPQLLHGGGNSLSHLGQHHLDGMVDQHVNNGRNPNQCAVVQPLVEEHGKVHGSSVAPGQAEPPVAICRTPRQLATPMRPLPPAVQPHVPQPRPNASTKSPPRSMRPW